MIRVFIIALVLNVLRYFLFSIPFFLLVNIFKPHFIRESIISNKKISFNQYQNELLSSFFSILIYSLVMSLTYYFYKSGYSKLIIDFDIHNLIKHIFVITFLMFFHDFYFYWSHRLLHTKYLNKKIHRTHHLSIQTTALTSLRFHPLEALVEALIMPMSIYLIPITIIDLMIFYFFVYLFNAYGHSGIEIHGKWFVKNKITKWLGTGVHHFQHHKYHHYNFGLYFTLWDRLMGTMYPKYENDFK